ncbi:preprotein translocase subunit SecG [bacterium F11]|nr:preprotein translocase subunit SecG [bacterium F11]
MYPVLLTVHVIVALLLILIVLIQAGRSGGLSGLMGGGGGDALFTSSSQQSGLRKITVIIAIIFLSTSFGLTLLSSRKSGQSIFQKALPALPPVNTQAPTSDQASPTEPAPVPVEGQQKK